MCSEGAKYKCLVQCLHDVKHFLSQYKSNIKIIFLKVQWSIPRSDEPIQMATAAMFFSLRMYCGLEQTSPIDVSELNIFLNSPNSFDGIIYQNILIWNRN